MSSDDEKRIAPHGDDTCISLRLRESSNICMNCKFVLSQHRARSRRGVCKPCEQPWNERYRTHLFVAKRKVYESTWEELEKRRTSTTQNNMQKIEDVERTGGTRRSRRSQKRKIFFSPNVSCSLDK